MSINPLQASEDTLFTEQKIVKKHNTYTRKWSDSATYGEVFTNFKLAISDLEHELYSHVANCLRTLAPEKRINVLDLGCGDCRHLPSLLEQLPHIACYLGIDINDRALDAAKNTLKSVQTSVDLDFRLANINSFSTVDSFNLIVSFNSLYGTPPHLLTSILEQNLAQNGLACVVLNCSNGLFAQLMRCQHHDAFFAEDYQYAIEIEQNFTASSFEFEYNCGKLLEADLKWTDYLTGRRCSQEEVRVISEQNQMERERILCLKHNAK